MSENWSRRENEAIVADYLRMLAAEQRGEPYSKTVHRNALAPQLHNRSKGSIERKHMNISAAMIDLGYPNIDGYKPLPNYQSSLAEVVAQLVTEDSALSAAVGQVAEAAAVSPTVPDILSCWDRPPAPSPIVSYNALREHHRRVQNNVNWLEVESNNRSLGRAGEEFVVRFERARLGKAGKEALADRVEHIAATRDGTGFDVRSFETNGRDRLIEVKTTAYGKLVPFFLSRNEIAVSKVRSEAYHLYRLFRFRTDPRLYGLKGSLEDTCLLEPVHYSARVK